MEISDEERRNIASSLRHDAAFGDGLPSEWWGMLQFIVLNEDDFQDPRVVFMKLAELIERPTCFDMESKDSNSFTCSACGFSESKLAVNPFALSFRYVKPSYYYCPSCGAEVA